MSITRVTWRHLLLTGLDGRSGFRMKRPLNSTPPRPNIPLSNIDVKAAGAPSFSEDGNTWTSARAPDEYPDSGGNRFVRAFWFISGRDHDPMGTGQTTGQTLAGSPSVNVTHNGGLWALHVTAYYIWDFGRGGGAHIVAVDAFDQDALDVADVDLITGLPKGFVGDFIPDDFVDVDIDPPWRPAQADRDRNTARTDSVNETGVLNTTSLVLNTTSLVINERIDERALIVARHYLPAPSGSLVFKEWLPIPDYVISARPTIPATVGAVGSPDWHDIVARQNDIVVAYAIYKQSNIFGFIPGPPEPEPEPGESGWIVVNGPFGRDRDGNTHRQQMRIPIPWWEPKPRPKPKPNPKPKPKPEPQPKPGQKRKRKPTAKAKPAPKPKAKPKAKPKRK